LTKGCTLAHFQPQPALSSFRLIDPTPPSTPRKHQINCDDIPPSEQQGLLHLTHLSAGLTKLQARVVEQDGILSLERKKSERVRQVERAALLLHKSPSGLLVSTKLWGRSGKTALKTGIKDLTCLFSGAFTSRKRRGSEPHSTHNLLHFSVIGCSNVSFL
jgi:hypothetical protein